MEDDSSEIFKKIINATDKDLVSEEIEESALQNIQEKERERKKEREENKKRLNELEQKDWRLKTEEEYVEEALLKRVIKFPFESLLIGELEKFGSVRSLEMMRRLKNSINSLNRTTFIFSIILIFLTGVLIYLTYSLLK